MDTYNQENTAFPFKAIPGLAPACEISFNADQSCSGVFIPIRECPYCRNLVPIPDNHDTSGWNQASPALNAIGDYLASSTDSVNLFYNHQQCSIETYSQENIWNFKASQG
jgi:hypothetical protein